MLPIVKCLKNVVLDILSVFLVTYNGRTSPVPGTLMPGSKSSNTFYICYLPQSSQALLGTSYPHFTELASSD